MTPSALNKICAHPVIISWVLGACAMDSAIIALLSDAVSLTDIASDWRATLFLALTLVPATLLGYIVGMFTCWPLMRVICSKFNGAPLEIGDHVMILAGPQKGNRAEVYEIIVGQGGWDLARLDLGPENKDHFTDIFEEYCLLKIKSGQPDGAV